ncbi:hypothetical protein PCE1_003253 [Barthelona sp. PCE]
MAFKYVSPLTIEQVNEFRDFAERFLSEPYTLYTYRFFTEQYADCCVGVYDTDSDKLVGGAICKVNFNSVGYIGMIAVDPDYRGHGLGSKILEYVIQAFTRRKLNSIELEVEICNVPAIALYEKYGFHKVTLFDDYYLTGQGAYRMTKELTPLSS